jgi:hypothetical protein
VSLDIGLDRTGQAIIKLRQHAKAFHDSNMSARKNDWKDRRQSDSAIASGQFGDPVVRAPRAASRAAKKP